MSENNGNPIVCAPSIAYLGDGLPSQEDFVRLYSPLNPPEYYSPERIRKCSRLVKNYGTIDGRVNWGYWGDGEFYLPMCDTSTLLQKLHDRGFERVDDEIRGNGIRDSRDRILWIPPDFYNVPQAELLVIVGESHRINFGSSGRYGHDHYEFLKDVSAMPHSVLRQIMGKGILSPGQDERNRYITK